MIHTDDSSKQPVTRMCDKCAGEVSHLKPKTRVKLPKELLKSLPGKRSNKSKVSDMEPEEYKQHRIYSRAYNEAYKNFHKDNGDGIKIYQDAYQKAYQVHHKQEMRAYTAEYRKKNPEYVERMWRRRRARERAVESQRYSTSDIITAWGTDCHICKEPIDMEAPRYSGAPGWEKSLHLDHVIPMSAGGPDTVDNVKPAHGQCNLRKQAKVLDNLDEVQEELKVLFSEKFGDKKLGRPKMKNEP